MAGRGGALDRQGSSFGREINVPKEMQKRIASKVPGHKEPDKKA